MDERAPILVGEFDDVIWIRVEGKGNFQNSPELKQFALLVIERGGSAIVIDLEDCPTMDSTFMGTLTGIAIRLKAVRNGKLDVVNANPRNRQLLESLGLNQILDVDTDGTAWSELRDTVRDQLGQSDAAGPLDKRDHAKFVLEAHEALVEANEENVRRFKDVIDYLKTDAEP